MKCYNPIRILSFRRRFPSNMAEEMFMFAVTAGIFAFMAAVLFGSRAKRYSQGYTPSEGHTEHG
jgi:hypothetical protein